jgi:hypothetical protein
MKNSFESVCNGFCDKLEGNIAKGDGSKLTTVEGVTGFRDETNMGVVEDRGVAIMVKDMESFFGNIFPYYVPVGVVKTGWEAIRAWCCQALHVFDGLIHFFSSEILLQIVMVPTWVMSEILVGFWEVKRS